MKLADTPGLALPFRKGWGNRPQGRLISPERLQCIPVRAAMNSASRTEHCLTFATSESMSPPIAALPKQ
jgi:hypothetical protein